MYQKRNNRLEIITLYSGDYKKRFYLREIVKLSKIPLKTIQNTLMVLEKEKILKSKVEGKNKYFNLNIDNIQTKLILLQSEIYKTNLFLETYPAIKTFLKSIEKNNLILVFGSFAKFAATKNSDLDMFIISDKEQKLPFHLLPYKIHKIFLAENSFIKAVEEQETLIKEIEENHVILNNHSFYVNLMWGYYGK